MTDPSRPEDVAKEAADDARWDAVEEATELLHEERFREALVELRDVAREDPANPYAFYFMGVALFESGELEAARDAYRACLHFAPDYLGARVSLSHVLRSLGELKDAIREGVTALDKAPGDGDAMHAVGLAYLARGDGIAAHKYLTAFLATNPEFEVAIEVRQLIESIDRGV